MVGIRNFYSVAADIPFTSSVALLTTGLKSAIAINEKQYFRAFIPVTVGATGGVRLQVVVPAGGSLFLVGISLYNLVAPSTTRTLQTASAAFTNALANAGNHWIVVEGTIINGATAGNVDIQMAQNTSDVLTMTVLKGGSMEVVKFS